MRGSIFFTFLVGDMANSGLLCMVLTIILLRDVTEAWAVIAGLADLARVPDDRSLGGHAVTEYQSAPAWSGGVRVALLLIR